MFLIEYYLYTTDTNVVADRNLQMKIGLILS